MLDRIRVGQHDQVVAQRKPDPKERPVLLEKTHEGVQQVAPQEGANGTDTRPAGRTGECLQRFIYLWIPSPHPLPSGRASSGDRLVVNHRPLRTLAPGLRGHGQERLPSGRVRPLEGTLKNPLHRIFQAGARKTRFPGAFIFQRSGA